MDGHSTTARERVEIYLGRRKVPQVRQPTGKVVRTCILAALFCGAGMLVFFGLLNGFDRPTVISTLLGTIVFGVLMTVFSLVKNSSAPKAPASG